MIERRTTVEINADLLCALCADREISLEYAARACLQLPGPAIQRPVANHGRADRRIARQGEQTGHQPALGFLKPDIHRQRFRRRVKIDCPVKAVVAALLGQPDLAMDDIIDLGIEIDQQAQLRRLTGDRLGDLYGLNLEAAEADIDRQLREAGGALRLLLRRWRQDGLAVDLQPRRRDRRDIQGAAQQLERRPGTADVLDPEPFPFRVFQADARNRELAEDVPFQRAKLDHQAVRVVDRLLDLKNQQRPPAIGLQEAIGPAEQQQDNQDRRQNEGGDERLACH